MSATRKPSPRETILVVIASLCVVGLALKYFLSRGPSRVEIVQRLDEAILRGDGEALYPYIWEEDRKANQWSPADVDHLLEQVVLRQINVAELRAEKPVMQNMRNMTTMERNPLSPSGNPRPWRLYLYDRSGTSRFSFSELVVSSLISDLDVRPDDYARAHVGYTAKKLREKQAFLASLKLKHYTYPDFENGVIRTAPIQKVIRSFETRSAKRNSGSNTR
ncbi:MAG: hypothetical protein SFX74_06285 [Fimbriimonadaceae bacterium]|nr:hypothetical protein [Fimbriimonadaceae bacterium]